MAIQLATAVRNDRLDAITARIDAGTSNGLVRIYQGVRPANPDTAITTQVLLAEVGLADPAAGAATGGVLTFGTTVTDLTADADGTPTFFRMVDSNGVAVLDGDCSSPGAGGDMEVDPNSVTAGGTFSISSIVITEGDA